MEKSTENNNKKNFLKEGLQGDISKHHKESLGTAIPEGYFSTSKLSILDKIKSESNPTKFLKEDFSDINQHHKEYLGTTVPEGYFEKSKLSILDKIKEEVKQEVALEVKQPKKQLVFYMRSQFRYIAAASLVFILSLTVWLQNSNNQDDFDATYIESLAFEDDVLIESLLIDDKDLDAFADATLFDEVVVKAELSEQKLDNLIINSLMVEDSLLDDYMDDKLLETIIL
ncbi:hypothetical protein [Polaribacter sp.]|uniref:hypothetical protein n=1 Tax=Polaribacter sp. TaxID=1920175 RepID=UPI0025ED4D6E|nr:hypothetical protein [Polaribacter sp.]